jgi:hypothetical protein
MNRFLSKISWDVKKESLKMLFLNLSQLFAMESGLKDRRVYPLKQISVMIEVCVKHRVVFN